MTYSLFDNSTRVACYAMLFISCLGLVVYTTRLMLLLFYGVSPVLPYRKALVRTIVRWCLFAVPLCLMISNMFIRFSGVEMRGDAVQLRYFWPRYPVSIRGRDIVRVDLTKDRMGKQEIAIILSNGRALSVTRGRSSNPESVAQSLQSLSQQKATH